jgi:hypothetical protein
MKYCLQFSHVSRILRRNTVTEPQKSDYALFHDSVITCFQSLVTAAPFGRIVQQTHEYVQRVFFNTVDWFTALRFTAKRIRILPMAQHA